MPLHRRGLILLAAAVPLMMVSQPAATQAPPRQDKLKVVATFSILADITRNIAGDRADVTALVGPNGDAHVYTPTPMDARSVGAAKVIVTNGLGFEGWISRLIAASGSKAIVAVASNGVEPRQSTDSHGHAGTDPHAWQSVANVKIYVANIRDALVTADPEGKGSYDANAAAYLAKLDALDRDIGETLARIPPARRKVITSHDAFGYFKDAYGIDFVAPLGVSTETEASARDVAKIITQVRQQKIPAVFLENVAEQQLVERIAAETGAKIGGSLQSDALTDAKGDAPTYIDLMRHNVRQLAAALAE